MHAYLMNMHKILLNMHKMVLLQMVPHKQAVHGRDAYIGVLKLLASTFASISAARKSMKRKRATRFTEGFTEWKMTSTSA